MKCMRGTAVNLSLALLPSEDGKHTVTPLAEFIIITTEPKYGIKTTPEGERVMTKTEHIEDVRISLSLADVKKLTLSLLDTVESLEAMERLKIEVPDGPDANAGTTPDTGDGTPASNEPTYEPLGPGDEVFATKSDA